MPSIIINIIMSVQTIYWQTEGETGKGKRCMFFICIISGDILIKASL